MAKAQMPTSLLKPQILQQGYNSRFGIRSASIFSFLGKICSDLPDIIKVVIAMEWTIPNLMTCTFHPTQTHSSTEVHMKSSWVCVGRGAASP